MLKKIAVALIAAGGLIAAVPAHAGGNFSLSIGVPVATYGYNAPPPAYYGPPPVVYGPPPVVYGAPLRGYVQPRHYAPRPHYAPPVVYVPARPYYDSRVGWRRGHGHDGWRH